MAWRRVGPNRTTVLTGAARAVQHLSWIMVTLCDCRQVSCGKSGAQTWIRWLPEAPGEQHPDGPERGVAQTIDEPDQPDVELLVAPRLLQKLPG